MLLKQSFSYGCCRCNTGGQGGGQLRRGGAVCRVPLLRPYNLRLRNHSEGNPCLPIFRPV